MFATHSGDLRLDKGHIDLSYRDLESWPNLTAKGSLKAYIFDIGDAEVGPNIQLGLVRKLADEPLDWKYSIDPVHHHGSDQFRVVSGGDWILAGRPMNAGDYSFQESGWIYQEHPGEHPGADEGHWIMLVMGDRRGNPSTVKMERDRETVFQFGEIYGVQTETEAYPHPAGNKGLAAIATTKGRCERGYRFGRIDELAPGQSSAALSGVLGDPAAGPLVHVLKSGPNETVIPACAYSTELVLAVVAGSCTIGRQEYRGGDLRIQQADAPLDAVISGPDGVEATLVVADRRARPVLAAGAKAPVWMSDVDRVMREIVPTPGGPPSRAAS